MPDTLTTEFAASMVRLEPFGSCPDLAASVSGGADSMALAVLANHWVRQRSGTVRAFVVDHGLRPDSAAEAELTIQRLHGIGIPGQILTLQDLQPGAALAERARAARYRILLDACAQAGLRHLLIGHHAADQVETVVMRVLRGSQTHGLAGMSAIRQVVGLRLLRPLLSIDPLRLRAFLQHHGIQWVEDPSNQDTKATRPRLRQALAHAIHDRTPLLQAIAAAGHLRQQEEQQANAELARRATFYSEGFALLTPGRITPLALGWLIQAIGGSSYPPALAQLTRLAAQPRPVTIAGVRFLPAGRSGDGLLVVREEAAIGEPVPARTGAVWDRRFRFVSDGNTGKDTIIDRLGADAARFRKRSRLPSAILRTIPAIRCGHTLLAVPHLGYATCDRDSADLMLFSPQRPLASLAFVPAG